jgi:hypothetical protein
MKEQNYWKNEDNVRKEVENLKNKYGFDKTPTAKEMQELGHSSLYQAISKYHGGLVKFKESLGETPAHKPQGHWKNIETVINAANDAIEDNGLSVLPSAKKLQQLGYSSLVQAIKKYHGGFKRFRDLLGGDDGLAGALVPK